MEFQNELKVPNSRIAVLIGTRGDVKKEIEKRLEVKIKIDSKEGDVLISSEDSLNLTIAFNIVKAIARGFNPEVALLLLNDEFVFETIDIVEFAGRSKKKLIRLRGRAIGMEGKSRENIEALTGTHVNIFGKTVSIIGDFEHVELARKAFESLLAGARHATIYAWLERQSRELKRARMIERMESRNK